MPPSALPKIAHTPLTGDSTAEAPQGLGKGWSHPRSQVSINLGHGDIHVAQLDQYDTTIMIFGQNTGADKVASEQDGKGKTKFPTFEELNPDQRHLLNTLGDGASVFNGLSDRQKACFLNITAALKSVGITTNGLSLKPLSDDKKRWGIQEDRLMFAPPLGNLEEQVKRAVKNREKLGNLGFKSAKPLKSEHMGMSDWGARQWVTTTAIQIGGGEDGAFVDIDEFGPSTDVVGLFGHGFEVLRNKITGNPTDPFKIGQKLRARQIETMYK